MLLAGASAGVVPTVMGHASKSLTSIPLLKSYGSNIPCRSPKFPCTSRHWLATHYMASPPPPEPIQIGGKNYRPIREGLASVLAPYRDSGVPPPKVKNPRNSNEEIQAVFYNPIQQFNRDLSVLAILAYGESALVQKKERFRKRGEVRKKQHENAKRRKQEAINGLDATKSQDSTVRKRKRDEDETENAGAKRQKSDQADEELEVLELHGVDPNADDSRTYGSNPFEELSEVPGDPPAGNKTSNCQGTPFTILDALSATGLRALRYAKEIPFATNIIANDLSSEAVGSIELNIDHNGVRDVVHSNMADARAYMYSKVGNKQQPASGKYIHRFDVIDLDPYGTAAPFFDAAVQALQDGGLLCVTCTDAAVFASNGYPEKAYALYNGTTVKGAHSQEGGLRLILHAMALAAARYGIAIEPLLSLSIDFYSRLFVRVHKSQQDVKLLAGTTMMVYSCDQGCGAWNTQLVAKNHVRENKNNEMFFKHGYAQGPSVAPNCEHCGFKMHLGGPMWAGPLHNPHFVQRILNKLPTLDKQIYGTTARLEGMLTVALEEDLTHHAILPTVEDNVNSSDTTPIPRTPPETIDQSPFFFVSDFLAKVIHCETPSEDQLRGALRHLGYRVTRSHCKAGSYKTDAPWNVLWEIFREWIRTKRPIKDGAVKPGTAGWAILGKARGCARKAAGDFRDEVAAKLEKAESITAIKTILESAMYRLAQDEIGKTSQPEDASSTNGTDGPQTTGATTDQTPKPVDQLQIVFDEKLGKERPRGKLVRYQINPTENWGPMRRAGGTTGLIS